MNKPYCAGTFPHTFHGIGCPLCSTRFGLWARIRHIAKLVWNIV